MRPTERQRLLQERLEIEAEYEDIKTEFDVAMDRRSDGGLEAFTGKMEELHAKLEDCQKRLDAAREKEAPERNRVPPDDDAVGGPIK